MKKQNLRKLLATALLTLGLSAASAQLYWTHGHGDIGIELHGDHFHTHWGLDAGSVVGGSTLTGPEEYHPEDIVLLSLATQASPAGSSAWLGLADGSTVYRAGNNNYQPNIGFSAYGIGSDTDWTGGGLTISLSNWSSSNPGDFALVRSNGTALFSTFDPGAAEGSLFIGAGDHTHLSWFFTAPGYYELTFTWAGEHITYGQVSISETYGFQVGAIPEPSTWAMLLAAGSAVTAVAVRRRKRSA